MLRIKDWGNNFETHKTRILKRLDWVPIPNAMDGLEYISLMEHPNCASHFGVWIALVEIASRCDKRGELMRSGKALDIKALSMISRIPASVIAEALPRLVEIGWVDTDAPETDLALDPARPGVYPALSGANAALDPATKEGKEEKEGKEQKEPPKSPEGGQAGIFSVLEEEGTLPPSERVEPGSATPVSVKTVMWTEAESTRVFNEEFWPIIWAKTGVDDARRKWLRVIKSREEADLAISEAKRQGPDILARGRRPGSSVLHPATWIFQGRFKDQGTTPRPTLVSPSGVPRFGKLLDPAKARELTPEQIECLADLKAFSEQSQPQGGAA